MAPTLLSGVALSQMSAHSSSSGSQYWVAGFPDLVSEWDADANGDLSPTELSAGSGRRVWWKCPRGPDHRWRAKPNNRTYGTGCPFCANRRVSVTNSLLTVAPELAREWDTERNGSVAPSDVVAMATRVVWWRCQVDPRHVWRRSVRERTRELSSCPFCANDRVCASNSLLATSPAIAAEWHGQRNAPLTPDGVTAGSSRRVWWHCRACAHDWRTSVANRVSRASGCPACARRGRDSSQSPPAEAGQPEAHAEESTTDQDHS